MKNVNGKKGHDSSSEHRDKRGRFESNGGSTTQYENRDNTGTRRQARNWDQEDSDLGYRGRDESAEHFGGRNADSYGYSDRDEAGEFSSQDRNYRGHSRRDSDYQGAGYAGNYNGNYGTRSNGNFRDDSDNSWGQHSQFSSNTIGSKDWEDNDQNSDQNSRQGRGMYRGKGPKGYTRSDERIQEDVNDRLKDDAHIDASEIEVSVSNGEITLTGTVSDRYQKRHAEDITELVSGVSNVENKIRVAQPGKIKDKREER